jgi:hypothetical protein
MELVGGGTLAQQVKEQGPQRPPAAVEAILAVVAGLEAAAEAGVLHRDIKPANCFVEQDGTVKVGDFGLSISLSGHEESQVTPSGAFVGTPAFASPEQLRGEGLDIRSDIYAVGATLYYLLTGRVPFEGAGRGYAQLVAATLEQEPEAPHRLRKEVPLGLSQVVMRCLAKERGARYESYAALRRELLPFGARAPVPAPLGLRAMALAVDAAVLNSVTLLASASGLFPTEARRMLSAFVCVLYSALLEWLWGTSVGKRLLGLRVVGPGQTQLSLPRSLIRSSIFWLGPQTAPWIAGWLVRGEWHMGRMGMGEKFISVLGTLFFYALLLVTIRRTNGFAAIHDLASRSQVVISPGVGDHHLFPASVLPEPAGRDHLPIGPYEIVREVWRSGGEELLVGRDPLLRRRVWLHVRPPGAPEVPPWRRDLRRPGRLHWLNGQRAVQMSWDAYEAPDGHCLADLPPAPWRFARHWLLALAAELKAGLDDSSLPPALHPGHIFITSNGRALLLDVPATPGPVAQSCRVQEGWNEVQRFLHETSRAAIVPVTVPLHARAFLQGLSRCAVRNAQEVLDQLRALVQKSPAVSPEHRLLPLVVGLGVLIALGTKTISERVFSKWSPFGQTSEKQA